MAKARYHHGNLREALIEAATKLVERDGAEAFSLAGASRAVGVTHAAAYKHFADRTDLLRAVSGVGMEAFGEALRDAYDAHDTPHEQYLAAGRAVVAFAQARPRMYQLAFGSTRQDDLGTLAAPPPGSALALFVTMLEGWQAAGLIKPGDATSRVLVLWSATHGLATLVASRRLAVTPEEAARLADDVLLQLLDGLG